MRTHWIKVAGVMIALIILVVIVLPLFINADTFRPTIQNQLSTALGRPATLGKLSFSIFKGSLVAENISIADDPAFSSTPFLQAKALNIGVKVIPLLMHRQLEITDLTIDTPSINLLHAANGRWNFSSIGRAAATQSPQHETAFPNLTVARFRIEQGTATVSSLPATGKPFVYSGITANIQNFSLVKSFPFDLTAALPASGSFHLAGTAGPISAKDAADTPFHATLTLQQFDPVAAGVIPAGQGISTSLDLSAQLTSDGNTLAGAGTVKASRLQLARAGSPAPQPVDIDYSISDNLDAHTGKINSLAIKTGNVAAQVNGGFQLTPQAVVLDLSLSAPNLPVDQLEELLPAVGIRLPSGSTLHGGSLTANLKIAGPASATTISGPVEIDNTNLAGFDLGSKIQGMNPFGGTHGGTQIQTLRATINASPQLTQISNIYGNLPQLGTATGSGTVAPNGAINFKMVATFNSNNAVGTAANQAINTVSGMLGGFLHPNAKPAASANRGIPLTITGTTSNPSIRADVVGTLRSVLK